MPMSVKDFISDLQKIDRIMTGLKIENYRFNYSEEGEKTLTIFQKEERIKYLRVCFSQLDPSIQIVNGTANLSVEILHQSASR